MASTPGFEPGSHWWETSALPLHLTHPQSSSHNAHGRSRGWWEGRREEESTSLSLTFLLPITPLAPLRRDREKRLGMSQPLHHAHSNSDEWKMKDENKSRWSGISITRWQNKRKKTNRNRLFKGWRMVKSETRRDAKILVRNPSPRPFGENFRDSKK